MRFRPGFSLIELMVVVAIMAVMAMAVSVSTSGWLRPVRMQGVVDRLVFMDRLTRGYVRRFDRPCGLVFDLEEGQVTRVLIPSGEHQGGRVRLPSGYRVRQVVTAKGSVGAGVVTIPYTGWGYAPTYALQVRGADGRDRWVLVAGLTGQVQEVNGKRDLDGLFAMLGE